MIYVASRASIPERAAMWRKLRDEGAPIISSWIDEAGEGETDSFEDLWDRIRMEVGSARLLVLYAEPDDFPLKGALIEVGMALGFDKRVHVVLPGVTLETRTCRPLGSWFNCRRVRRFDTLADALTI